MRLGDDSESQIVQAQQDWILGWVITLIAFAIVGVLLWVLPDRLPKFALAYGVAMALSTALLFEWDRRVRLRHWMKIKKGEHPHVECSD